MMLPKLKMTYSATTRRLLSCALMALLLTVTAGCKPQAIKEALSTAAKPVPDQVSVMTDSVNYMYERSVKYTLYDLSQTPPAAIGGAIVDRLASGGAKGCCIALPKTWKPGMKVRLQWHESDHDNIYKEHTRDLEIPRYDTASDLYVVFYPKHEVEVVVSVGEPGNPTWRGKIKQTPWDHCVATAGRKACKAALPKQFDAVSSQGLCSVMKETNFPDAENLCESAMEDCIRDYEDEPFCKKTLWAPACRDNNKDDPYCIEKAQEKK